MPNSRCLDNMRVAERWLPLSEVTIEESACVFSRTAWDAAVPTYRYPPDQPGVACEDCECTSAKVAMLSHTDADHAPWITARSNDKKVLG